MLRVTEATNEAVADKEAKLKTAVEDAMAKVLDVGQLLLGSEGREQELQQRVLTLETEAEVREAQHALVITVQRAEAVTFAAALAAESIACRAESCGSSAEAE